MPGVADTEGHARLSGAVRIALPVAEGREVVVGVRPEDLPLTGDAGIPAKVVAHEPLPEAGIATLAHGERVRVTADPDHTHAFDAKTGAPCDERIRACRRRWRPLHPAVAHHGGTRP
ncbi:hypothetical protein LJ657_01260 [Streptomyces sp. NR30]|uniref:Transport-associated OB type 2 domain-containing protein n=1 Tax=Streptomyces guryensis TaxID=2886947 RepID=A0A9Q3VIV7_9ACTN|nr:hypothetical protein [Streptomyces guryensis]